MKSYGKITVRLFREHIVRLITIIAIVLVSVGIIGAISELYVRLETAADNFYESQNISDLYVKSKRESPIPGFTANERRMIKERFGEENVLESFCLEEKIDGRVVRLYAHDLTKNRVNKIQIVDGALPTSLGEALVERGTEIYESYNVGDKIEMSLPYIGAKEFTVSGIAINPLLIENTEETSYQFADETVGAVLYVQLDSLPAVNDVYISVEGISKKNFRSYSKDYERKISALKLELCEMLGEENVAVLTLYENRGMYSLVSFAKKVGLISIVFAAFFILVTMLVVYSNMSRLFDEERGRIACLKTLGYSNFAVIFKYLLFVLLGTAIGGLLAIPVVIAVTSLLYTAFGKRFAMPPFPSTPNLVYYAVAFVLIVVGMIFLTYYTGMKLSKSKPVSLLTPKAPKAGKRVILERITPIWNRLSFKYKSTVRNVLLFKSRFLMTVISIMGSTVLVFAGLGLMDCSFKGSGTAAILGIAAVLVVFSAALCGLVIYNLTDINVSERRREIATLMVLGYHDREVGGYIFREIYIMSAIGAVLGVPAGVGFMAFLFSMIKFGSIGDINWWTYMLAPAVTMFFAFLSTLLLRRKILKTDMNASLKTLE